MYKVYVNDCCCILSNMFVRTSNVYSRIMRASSINNFFVPYCRTNIGKNFIVYAGTVAWNKMSSDCSKMSYNMFKKMLRAKLLPSNL